MFVEVQRRSMGVCSFDNRWGGYVVEGVDFASSLAKIIEGYF